jgi:hypothetical protein
MSRRFFSGPQARRLPARSTAPYGEPTEGKDFTMERKASSKSGAQASTKAKSKGQKTSSERGTATPGKKKNPGSRAQQGGSSR